MKYVDYSIGEIKKKFKDDKDTVVRIETASGSVEPRLIRILEIGEDFIVGRGRKKSIPEVFNFNQIASWRFAEFQKSEWNW
jgi:hypothetical protein